MAWHSSQGDRQTVPSIDSRNCESEVYDLFIAEMFADVMVDSVGNVRLGDQRDGLRPRQGSALPIRVERSFAPSIECVKTLLCFAQCSGVFGMHVNTIGAPVDLRSAHLQQMNEAEIKSASCNILFERGHGLLSFLSVPACIYPRFHKVSPILLANLSAALVSGKPDDWLAERSLGIR